MSALGSYQYKGATSLLLEQGVGRSQTRVVGLCKGDYGCGLGHTRMATVSYGAKISHCHQTTLKASSGTSDGTPEQQKFVANLMGFEFEILDRLGRQNAIADDLSRCMGGPLLRALTGLIQDIWERLRRSTQVSTRVARAQAKDGRE